MPLVIEGQRRLMGEVEIGGAKNAALPIMAATILTPDECWLENVPYIEDIRSMMRVLHHLGVAARFEGPNCLRIKATRISKSYISHELAQRMRASFLVAGPLLARFGQAEAPQPGGCAIGNRPVSVDLAGFQAMGGVITSSEDGYTIKAPRLKAPRLVLDYPSHTGTENLLMAACLAEGTTIIENASVEPEVLDLASFLSAMGARISGAGTSVIQVEGTHRLHGAAYRVMPDRMEAGTFALGALITGGDVTMDGAVAPYLGALTSKMRDAGASVEAGRDRYRIRVTQALTAVDVQTYPYPGFPTDLQAPFATAMTQARGSCAIHETMFDGRLQYITELRRMGALIDLSSGRTAIIHGPTPLRGTQVTALDIRSGAAMVLAGLAAEGTTRIDRVVYIDRGYENLDAKLSRLGAAIARVEESEHPCPAYDCAEPVDWTAHPMDDVAS